MRKVNLLPIVCFLFLAPSAKADPVAGAATSRAKSDLTSDLEALSITPKASPTEDLYVIQPRPMRLGGGLSVNAGIAKNFHTSVYLESTENNGQLTYHFTDRYFASLYGSYVYNDLTESGQRLWQNEEIYPDTSFIRRRYDLTLGFNAIYGKARITRDLMFYFDQYVAIGGGVVEQTNGVDTKTTPVFAADIGLSFWFGRFNVKLGAKDHYFEEHRLLESSKVHHYLGYSTLGYLLGGNRRG